ncbi:nuclear transport factor 2 family protein [Dyella sp. C11]|uniref:nuclear transport factor 2 family protein n=1 Tax=Dyella sp. C11 TaxID=2126991 RepID=UPI000D6553B8|nr:nuclear transport factor 2 family protein [Dyella sp. C11]
MTSPRSAQQLLIDMFNDMVIKRDFSALPRYYHPDFQLETNGRTQDYHAFLEGHRNVYASGMTYAVRYDDEAWVTHHDRVAARVWITTQRPNEAAVEYEVILLATVRDGKIHRLWELTRPDWTVQKAFAGYDSPAACAA